ncbi:S8 family peptidase [Streptomyces sp. NPDC026665]|uniref:S8 family peptidase n=1 Tax=Streptomyces sp. NPDC026665 TaxID=3154798 RepID=UPI003401AF8C
MNTPHHGECFGLTVSNRRPGVAKSRTPPEVPMSSLANDVFRTQLIEARNGGLGHKFSALATFRPPVTSTQDAVRLLKVAVLPRLAPSSSRFAVQGVVSNLSRSDEVSKWLLAGEYPRRYGGALVDGTADALLQLLESEVVESLEEDVECQLCVDRVCRIVNCDLAFHSGLTGCGVTVAVVDTGIDASHAAFKDRISTLSRNFITKSNDVTDADGHGTHVAGIIGGNGAASHGQQLRGIAPGVSLMVLKVNEGIGQTYRSGLIGAAVSYAAKNGADVINVSGGRPASVPPSGQISPPWVWSVFEEFNERAVSGAIADGSAITIAAGNHGWEADPSSTIYSPAINQHALTVGSVNLNSQSPQLSSFSSQGPVMRTDAISRGRVRSLAELAPSHAPVVRFPKPDVVAPGGEMDFSSNTTGFGCSPHHGVVSTKASVVVGESTPGFSAAASYIAASGTSMSCPVAAGVAALITEYARRNDLGLTERLDRAVIIHNIIRAGARNLGLSSHHQGFGLIDWENIQNILTQIKKGRDDLENYRIDPLYPE